MARYRSILEITGKIDDFVFYNLNGVPVMRKKSGFNGTDYKQKDSYEAVRNNSSEFGRSSKFGKILREAIGPFPSLCGDKYLYQKFAKLMATLKDLDLKSERGKRTVHNGLQTTQGQELLKNFSFGEIGNVNDALVKTDALFNIEIKIYSPALYDELILFIIETSAESDSVKTQQITMPVTQKKSLYIPDTHTETDLDNCLYFAVLKKSEVIQKMGFI